MISIKRHLDDAATSKLVGKAHVQVLEAVLQLLEDRMPTSDDDERLLFSQRLAVLMRKLEQKHDPQAIESSSPEIVRVVGKHWDRMEDYFSERERELTAIIALLAETAGKLDQSNRDYYKSVHHSVQSLKTIGKLDDISALRRALTERVKNIELAVQRQEEFSRDAMARLQTGIKRAQSEVQVMGKFVSTKPLNRLPSRGHAERYIAGLVDQQRRFVLGIVTVHQAASVARRLGEDIGESLITQFSGALRREMPEKVSLYHWDKESFVALSDEISVADMRSHFKELVEQSGNEGLQVGKASRRVVHVKPECAVHEPGSSMKVEAIVRLVDQFCKVVSDGQPA
jgi:GGDEF domain-containing protein